MSVTAEQQVLLELVIDRVEQMQRAVVAALPGATALHEAFLVGQPLPSTPAEVVQAGQRVAPAAREYRALLLNRGLDAAELARFGRALQALEALAMTDEPSTPVAPEPASKPAAPKRKSTRKRAS